MSRTGFVRFEREFPEACAEAIKGLVDGARLDEVVDRLCTTLTGQIAPSGIELTRLGDDGSAEPGVSAGTNRATLEVDGPDGVPWGVLVLSGADHDDARARLDTVAGFVTWIVDRYKARQRHVTTIDRERQFIAGQLHDDSIQAMTAISLHLQRLARSPGVEHEQIDRLLHLTNSAIERLRHMMFALHPPSLANDGLVTTLEDYLEGFIAPAGLRTTVHGDAANRCSPTTEALAFRLARGAIHNSWKHARASSIDVAVDVSPDGVHIVVRDDGIGFDVATARTVDVGHAGIEYSRDLANEVGGKYDISSERGAGTTVSISLPIL